MSDMPSYDRNKAAIRQRDTPLNKDGGKGQVPCGPKQGTTSQTRQDQEMASPWGVRPPKPPIPIEHL
jgi:hypothetical protein